MIHSTASIGYGIGDGVMFDDEQMTEPSRGAAYIDEDGSKLTIGNDHLLLELDKNTKCGIARIIDVKTGEDLRGNKLPPPVIFMLMYWTGNVTDIVLQWDAETMSIEKNIGVGYVNLTISYRKFRGSDLNATVMIDLKDDSRYLEMRMEIQNDEDFIVRSLFFPVIWGIDEIGDESEDDKVFYPVGDGMLLSDPLYYKDDLHMAEMYPSTASMQMMCYFDPEETGFYLTSDDGAGHPKKPTLNSMEWSTQTHLAMFFENLIPETTGNDYLMPYRFRLGSFEGDWYEAAQIYTDWAMTTDFVSGGKVFEDKDTPHWWSRTSVISSSNRDGEWIHNSLSDIENMTAEFNELTGVNTTHLIFAWAKEGAWCGPYYFPPAAGEENFTNSMDEITRLGGHSFLYISGSVWRITRGDIGYEDYQLFNDIGRKWACIDQYGNPTIDQGYLQINWTSARMCPMTDFWQEMVVNNTLSCLDLGVDVVQIDEFPIGSIFPCYNSSHGHPLGYSNQITGSYREILDEARIKGRIKNSDFIMSMEEPCEFYIPYMDSYVSRDNSPEFLIYPIAIDLYGDDVEFIPFFSHVYHEHITAFSEPIPMNNDYPELFMDQMKRSIARAFVSGEIISGSADSREDLRPEVIDLYNRTVRASTGYCNDYLIKGKPLKPPKIDVPDEPVDWFFYSQQKIGRQFNESSVLGSSWEADSGDIGHVLLNWIDEPVDFNLEIPAYNLEGGRSILITTNGRKEVLMERVELPVNITLSTEPGDLILIEVTNVPDLMVQDLQIVDSEAGILVNDSYRIDITISNSGTGISDEFGIELMIDDVSIDSSMGPVLEPGSGHELSFTMNTTGFLGIRNVSLIIDGDQEIFELDEGNNLKWELIEVFERPRAFVMVVVNDTDTGIPLRNASVTLENDPGGSYFYLELVTNDNGEVHFSDIVSGRYSLYCSMDHYWQNSTSLHISEGDNITLRISLKWRTFPYISGVVTNNETQKPIEGVDIELYYHQNTSDIIVATTTSPDGVFNFTELEFGVDYLIRAIYEGYHIVEVMIGPDPFDTIEIGLDRMPPIPGIISGRVIDNGTGDPIPGVLVYLVNESIQKSTDENGRFNITGLMPGSYDLEFSFPGYNDIRMDLKVEEDRTTDIMVAMVLIEEPIPGTELFNITGYLLDIDGIPIENGLIKVKELNISTFTDKEGYFEFVDLDIGNYTLLISADGFTDMEIRVHSDDPEITINMLHIEVDDDGSSNWIIPFAIAGILLFIAVVSIVVYTRGKGEDHEE